MSPSPPATAGVIGTAFHPRTAPLNRKAQWREWAGYFAASVYHDGHLIEYNAIREAAALIDVSPLYKYRVSGPDAVRLVDRVITRDATKIRVGQVVYSPWCDEEGKVVDDGTIARLDETAFRWTAADPNLRWLRLNARGLDVEIEEMSEEVAAVALQGPRSRAVLEAATGEEWSDLRYYRRRTTRLAGTAIDVSRTGYTGDLGYELWIPAGKAARAWDALMTAGAPHGIRPAGMLALDVARLEAGLILIEVDYTSSRHAWIPEQRYSPFEIGLGRLVDLDGPNEFVGKQALRAEREAGGPKRRLVGLEIDWADVERLHQRQGLAPTVPGAAWRTAVPLYAEGRRQVGRATSGTWSPTLKKLIALGSVDARFETPGTPLWVEWTVAARRGLARATVVPLPFFDPPRKRA
ncbi:MAG TPA: aminomethyltransferase family protein [Candidatus Limnocylindrales bacterium]|nr:aminomethyltransferase family protein [Candidatus Limnocylindrales bacterium]